MYCLFFHNATTITFFFFFFNDTATTEIYTLSLHDALPISGLLPMENLSGLGARLPMRSLNIRCPTSSRSEEQRLNSSHSQISYAVFCLKKKKKKKIN